jgi:hypothetical protein
MKQLLEAPPLSPQPSRRHFQAATRHCYTVAQICHLLSLSRRTFFALKAAGTLPLVELTPRLGRLARYHALPIDRYLAGGR